MAQLAADATFSFSLVPLKIALVVGLVFLMLAAAEVIYVLSFWLTGRQHLLAPGWASLMFMLLIVGAALMISLALLGMYVGYIFPGGQASAGLSPTGRPFKREPPPGREPSPAASRGRRPGRDG